MVAKILRIIPFVLVPFASVGQTIEELYVKADKEFYDEDFKEALPHLEDLIEMDPNYKDVQYLAEIVKLLTFDKRRPMDKFFELAEAQGKNDKFKDYWLGRIYARKWHFDEAIAAWKSFLRLNVYKSPEIVEETKQFIHVADRMERMMEEAGDYDVRHLSFNTPYPDFAKFYSQDKDELVFASRRGSNDLMNYYSTSRNNINWNSPSNLSGGSDNAYFSVVDSYNKISTAIPTNIIKDIKDTRFHMNEGKDVIVFVEEDKDGTHNLNIIRKNSAGSWGKAEELPFPINTEYDEDHPFLSKDGHTLYFSTNRPDAIGGYDIFVCEYNDNAGVWTTPHGLEYPINSPDNEVSFYLTEEGNDKSGFFSSDRVRMELDYDIFQFNEIVPIKVSGRLLGLKSNIDTKDLRIKFLAEENDHEFFIHEIENNGDYNLKLIHREPYLVEVLYHDSLLYKENFDLTDFEGFSLIKNLTLSSGYKESLIHEEIDESKMNSSSTSVDMLGSKFRVSNVAVSRNIYFDYGKASLQNNSTDALNGLLEVMKKDSNINVEISGHTDNTGPHDHNMKLSLDRANSVKQWLISQGINPSRIKTVGYGETKPLASNDDEVNGRELNRRIEIRRLDSSN